MSGVIRPVLLYCLTEQTIDIIKCLKSNLLTEMFFENFYKFDNIKLLMVREIERVEYETYWWLPLRAI